MGVGVVDGVTVLVGVAVSVGDIVIVLVIAASGKSDAEVEDITSPDVIGEDIGIPRHDERNTAIKSRAGKTRVGVTTDIKIFIRFLFGS